MKIKEQKGQGGKAGEGRKKEYDKRSALPALAQVPHRGIGHPGAQSSQQADQGWNTVRKSGSCRLDDKQAARKRCDYGKELERLYCFFQKEERSGNDTMKL